jgi:hypothetical protein
MEHGVYLFTADGRLLVRPAETDVIHEASDRDRQEAARSEWTIHQGMWLRWGRGRTDTASE